MPVFGVCKGLVVVLRGGGVEVGVFKCIFGLVELLRLNLFIFKISK